MQPAGEVAAGEGSASPGIDSNAAADPLEQLRKLAELRDAGLVTDAEFEAEKTELLRRV